MNPYRDVASPSPIENTEVELLLAEFNEALRCEGRADFGLLERCPVGDRRELTSLMNCAALAYLALKPEREALASERYARRTRRAS